MFDAKLTTIPMVYSYIRFSSMGQADGSSEARQHETVETYAETYAAQHGMRLADPLRDLGLSGWKGTHRTKGAMGDFIAAVEAGKVGRGSVFIVEDIDRFSRERASLALATLITFMQRGLTVITTRDGAIYTPADWDRTAKLVPLVCYINAAHDYSERLSGRVRKAKALAMDMARKEGKPLSKRCPAWLSVSPDGRRYDVIPTRADAVRRIFALACEGFGSYAIAAKLNDEGVQCFYSEAWNHKNVNFLVTSRTPTGELAPKSGAPLPTYYPAIITLDTWTAAQQARKANASHVRTKLTSGAVLHNLFTGLLFCSTCGGKIQFQSSQSRKGGATRLRLYCANALAHTCSANGSFPYAVLERAVLDRLAWMDKEGLLNAPASDAGEGIELEVSRLSLAIESANAELDAITNGFGGNIPAPVIASMARKATAITDLENRLRDAQAALLHSRPVLTVEHHKAALAALRAAVDAGDYDARLRVRTALRGLIARIEINFVGLTVNEGTGPKYAEVLCANDYQFIVYGHGATVDIETGGPVETMGRTFTINKPVV